LDQLPKLDEWLRAILWDLVVPGKDSGEIARSPNSTKPFEIHRLKARLPVENGSVKVVQGVREIFEISDSPEMSSDVRPQHAEGKLVLIGRHISDIDFKSSYLSVVNP
jgi:hypothetical protein